jgi:hypothetical protein
MKETKQDGNGDILNLIMKYGWRIATAIASLAFIFFGVFLHFEGWLTNDAGLTAQGWSGTEWAFGYLVAYTVVSAVSKIRVNFNKK